MYFPEFIKVDCLKDYKVLDVAIGKASIHAFCQHNQTQKIQLFGWGSNQSN